MTLIAAINSAVSCVKRAESIETQSGMMRPMGSGNVLHGDVDASMGRGTFEGVWPVENHCQA